MYAGILKEDGQKHFTKAFPTAEEAKAEGKRIWIGSRFNILELTTDLSDIENGVYEAVSYVAI